jgi:(R)-2-hydroxyacyl-CoA dehydratese activating ATPase
MSHFAGIDIGSLATKCVIVNDAMDIVAKAVVPTGARVAQAGEAALRAALESGGIDPASIALTIATGYGRKRVAADARVTEITCHARGAVHLFPGTRTVLDIGGQDTKAIRVGAKGEVANFAMNDKCAAGTGRFLEVMARALEVDLEDLGPLSRESTKPQTISSFCTVFGESEVVSHIADGAEIKDIARGLHAAIAQRVIGLLKRVGIEAELTMSGGVARNVGMRDAIERELGLTLNVSDESQIIGALGAALIARQRYLNTGEEPR